MSLNSDNDEWTKKYNSIINSNANIESSSNELTVEDIVRDKTILDRIDVIPNPFESKENTRINYPPFEEMFYSTKKRYRNPSSVTANISQNPDSSKNSSLYSGSFNRSTHNDSSTHFRWSIDQIARLLPADIEYKLQDDTLTIFRPHDEETQQKIDEYFSNTVLPSPYTPDSKKISPASILSRLEDFFTVEPSPTELYLSHGTNGKFIHNKHIYNVAESTNLNAPTLSEPSSSRTFKDCRSYTERTNKNLVEVSCQTDVSIHPEIDISKFLGEMLLIKQDSCMVHNSSSKIYDSNETPGKHEITPDQSVPSNINSTNKNGFYDVKFIQNSTANDVLDVFHQLDISSNGSLSHVAATCTTNEANSKRKNLHVTFKEDTNLSLCSNDDHQPLTANSLPNPLQNGVPLLASNNNNKNSFNDHYSLDTPPIAFRIYETHHNDTPFSCNKKQRPSPPISTHTPVRSSTTTTAYSFSPRNDFHSSFVDANNADLHFTSHIHFNSNLSSPSWNLTKCSKSYFHSVNNPKKGSPLTDLDDLDKCFGSINTSPIKPFHIFNSTTTDMNVDNNNDDAFLTKYNPNIKGFKDDPQPTIITESKLMEKSHRDQSTEIVNSATSGSALESGYSSNAASITTSSNHNNKKNATINPCEHVHSSYECREP